MSLTIRPLTPWFGAEIRGTDLRRISDEKFAEIYSAFLEFGVLVIPGQPLSIEEHLAFASRFGELWTLPVYGKVPLRVDNPAIDDVSNLDEHGNLAGSDSRKVRFALGNQLWHSDLSFRDVPAQASLLHAVEIADEGGETEFADLHAPYEELPRERRAALEGLIAEHSLLHSRARMGFEDITEADRKAFPPALQPLVREHCETRRRGLFVGAHAYRIRGLPDTEGAALLEELLQFATQPKFTYSHRWAVYDLVIWDNRRVLHRGRPYDIDNCRRVMHRATIKGRGPTVVDDCIVVA